MGPPFEFREDEALLYGWYWRFVKLTGCEPGIGLSSDAPSALHVSRFSEACHHSQQQQQGAGCPLLIRAGQHRRSAAGQRAGVRMPGLRRLSALNPTRETQKIAGGEFTAVMGSQKNGLPRLSAKQPC